MVTRHTSRPSPLLSRGRRHQHKRYMQGSNRNFRPTSPRSLQSWQRMIQWSPEHTSVHSRVHILARPRPTHHMQRWIQGLTRCHLIPVPRWFTVGTRGGLHQKSQEGIPIKEHYQVQIKVLGRPSLNCTGNWFHVEFVRLLLPRKSSAVRSPLLAGI